MDDDDAPDEPEVVEVPITDELDLHTFSPKEVGSLVPEYLEAAHAKGLREVRVIHGKGTGVRRERVHALLRRHPLVASFRLGDEARGTWGATIVVLREAPEGQAGGPEPEPEA